MTKIAVLLSFIFLLSPAVSNATLVTEGFIKIASPTSGDGYFDFSGDGFHVTGGLTFNTKLGMNPHPYPSQLDPTGITIGNDIYGGVYDSGSLSIRVQWGDLDAAGPSLLQVTGEPIPLTMQPGAYTGLFSFTGSLFGTSLDPSTFPHPCVACLPLLEGSGIVTALVSGPIFLGETPLFTCTEATYTFTNPVPMPSTLILLGTGLIGLAVYQRKRLN
jgi:hypothetical protein